ncbi:MAG: hypothetical protein QM500_04915 [Methylococcales bacterium]
MTMTKLNTTFSTIALIKTKAEYKDFILDMPFSHEVGDQVQIDRSDLVEQKESFEGVDYQNSECMDFLNSVLDETDGQAEILQFH